MQLKKILCPVDFSDATPLGVKPALSLAREFDAELIFLHVVDFPGTATTVDVPGFDFQEFLRSIGTEAERRTKQFAEEHSVEGRASRAAVEHGFPAVEIVGLAEAENADLIVIPTHSRRGLERLLMGSVAEKVVRLAPCRVLTVHADAGEASDFRPDKIIFATDFSDFADAALPDALFLAERFGADLLMVHVATVFESDPANPEWSFPEIPAEYAAAVHEQTEKKLDAQGNMASTDGFRVETRMLKGFDPAMEIVEASRKIGAGLVVMATHGQTGFTHALVGSTAERVVRYADCPVLTVRP